MTGELVDSELLDDLQNVEFFGHFFLCISEQEVFTCTLWPATAETLLVEAHEYPEALILIAEGLTRLYFLSDALLFG